MSNSYNKSPFSFNPPVKFNPSKFGKSTSSSGSTQADMLFNKKKISSDVLSMSSKSSSSSSISSSASSRSGTSQSDTSSQAVGHEKFPKYSEHEEDSDIDGSEIEDSVVDHEDDNDEETPYNKYESLKRDKKQTMMNELNEKRELLYQMDRLESKGYRLPFKFNMESDINEMRSEYIKIVREKEVDASIRFQRKMLMAFVTGTEYLNTRYDPFAVKLDGWSEQVHENIMDYDDIFEELHAKYKATGKKMSPELRLFISLSGSAFMFHLTSRMFKESPLPNVEQVLKSNPELMKQFQQAAAKQYITGQYQSESPDQSYGYGQQQMNGMGSGVNNGGGGLFGMVSSLFNNLGGGPSRPQMYQERDDDEISNSSMRLAQRRRPPGSNAMGGQGASHRDIDSIIKNVHNKISLDQEQNMNNIETLSVSDEEITSIIEDTADIKILRNAKNNKNIRTLNL
jgi:hypothetical protein